MFTRAGKAAEAIFQLLIQQRVDVDQWPVVFAASFLMAMSTRMLDVPSAQRETERARLLHIVDQLRQRVEAWTPSTKAEEDFFMADHDDLPKA